MSKWPKKLPTLNKVQKSIENDFVKNWHMELAGNTRYRYIEKFNHSYILKHCRQGGRVLEIGAGLGEHLYYEDLTKITEYTALELRPAMARIIKKRFPLVKVILGDCQKRFKVRDGYFDRVVAVHVLEHLPNLPATLKEVHRVLKPGGEFCVVIPCEGGWAYDMARRLSAKKLFKQKYGMDYEWFTKRQHVNLPWEIDEELEQYFTVNKREFFPLKIPIVSWNLVISMILKPLPRNLVKI